MTTKIVLQPIVAGPKNGDLTESKIKPQIELSEGEFLALADHGKAMSVNGEQITVFETHHGRYIVK